MRDNATQAAAPHRFWQSLQGTPGTGGTVHGNYVIWLLALARVTELGGRQTFFSGRHHSPGQVSLLEVSSLQQV